MENSLIHQERAENEHHTPLIASDRVEGTAVYNRRGDRLASVDHVMIDKVSGKVEYVVLSFGGFLGVGTNRYPLPWDKLEYDTKLGGYVTDLTSEQLEKAPNYDATDRPEYAADYTSSVNDFYG